MNGDSSSLLQFSSPPSRFALKQFWRVSKATPKKIRQRVGEVWLLASQSVPFSCIAVAACHPVYDSRGHVFPQPLVLYNPEAMTILDFASGNDFTTLSVLAHELGHHVHGHTLPSSLEELQKHPWNREFEADEFAGFVLARLKAKPDDLLASLRVWFCGPSHTHPGSVERAEVAFEGWKKGGGRGMTRGKFRKLLHAQLGRQHRWFAP